MVIKNIETLLYDTIGLNTDSIGQQAVIDAVKVRMQECGIECMNEYYQNVSTQASELKELVEEVVVPETWFFRDSKPFKQLIKYADNEWGVKTSFKPLRILSLPCATGEEAYSIAMTLLDAGFMPSQVEIEAFDISHRNIQRCKEATYRPHSFRGVDNKTRDKFFRPHEDKYKPDILIKSMVNFSQVSILDPSLLYGKKIYDVIFCRNLLIYFDAETQQKAIKALHKLLSPKGLLFLGHAETAIFLKDWYLSKRFPKAFIVRKFDDDINKKNIPGKNKHPSSLARKVFNPVKRTTIEKQTSSILSALDNKTKPTTANVVNKETLSIHEAELLFKEQDFTAAEQYCLTLLNKNKQDIQIHSLLGEINLENNNIELAKKYFHNVIYLQPDNYDALMKLHRIELKNGNKPQAERLMQRAQRALNKANKV